MSLNPTHWTSKVHCFQDKCGWHHITPIIIKDLFSIATCFRNNVLVFKIKKSLGHIRAENITILGITEKEKIYSLNPLPLKYMTNIVTVKVSDLFVTFR